MINFEKIFNVASLTPSGDNLQPWTFTFEDAAEKMFIYHNYKISAHSFNPDNIASCVSFGMMMFAIEDEALRQGYEVKFVIHEAALTTEEAFIECHFEKKNTGKLPLFPEDVYYNRKTSREPFVRNNLPMFEMKKFLDELSKKSDYIDLKMETKVSNVTLKWMKKVESVFWNKKNYLQEIFQWVHFSKSKHEAIKRGFHWKELGAMITDLPFLILIKYATPFAIILYNAFIHLIIFRQFTKSLDHSGLVMLSLKRKPNVVECLEIGKTVMHLWLKIADLGMVSQPLSIQTFFISFTSWGFYDKEWPQSVLKQLEGNLNKDFKVADTFKPFWLFRFGYESDKSKPIRSIKLTKAELLK